QDVTTQNRALRTLRDAERRKDQFLAMLAHELRNPLAPMRSAADLLQQLSPSREDMFRARDVIGRQLHHLTRLVDELLDISRFNQGKITLRQDLVELRSALNTAVETVRPLLEANGHTLRLSLPEQPLPVRGDLVRLTQIFSNLLHNAVTYTPAGGQVSVEATTQDGNVTVRVRDNGAGLSEAMQRQLFDPLAPEHGSGDTTSADAQRGSALQDGPGIGLTLVQKLVRLHGGRIHAESPGPGEGSTFIVVLPVEPWQNWHPPSGMTVPRSGPPRTVMLVDDNIDALEAMTMTLQTLGHTVVTAPDGQSAVARAASVRPDVILLDLGMPAMDGFETARRLRALPELRGAKLVALTGFGQPEDRRRTLEAGFDLHLVKPANLDALTRLLDGLDA
ncbi:MAG TPA: ATP-binding protein, partial [Steroidobacteraceae bacterium]|nr:ATP-binding protein [Steroidobacteraceae bacterium]